MHRVDTATASPSLPGSETPGTPGYFTKGDPGLGVPATVPGQDMWNTLVEELCNVVTGLGGTLDATKANRAQIRDLLIAALATKAGLSAANVFTVNQRIQSVYPRLFLEETDAAADGKLWDLAVDTGTVRLRSLTDAAGLIVNLLNITRAGDITFGGNLISPVATGTPAVPTAAQGTKTTQAASTEFMWNELAIIGPEHIRNIGYVVSVAAKALTVARKTQALADPSTSSQIEVAFRRRTLTVGDYLLRAINAAHSITAPNGATLGFAAGESGRLYIYECDNSALRETGLSKRSSFSESLLWNTTAISAGADSGSVLYTTTAMTNAAVRLIGYFDITTGAVAGEWDNEDTLVVVGSAGYTGVVAEFTNSSTSSLGHALTIPAEISPINLEVGDLITIKYRVHGVPNGTGQVHTTTITKNTGTAEFEAEVPSSDRSFKFLFNWPAILIAVGFGIDQTITKRVTTAGTLTGFSNTGSDYGAAITAPQSQSVVTITRARR